MIKYAFIDKDIKTRAPEYSHGDAYSSMCIDMYNSKTTHFTRGANLKTYVQEKSNLDFSFSGSSRLEVDTEYSDVWEFPDYPFVSILPYAIVETNIAFELPRGLHLSWGGRSGAAFKSGRMIFEGKIDSIYRGELKALVYSLNVNDLDAKIDFNEKFAQLELVDYRTESAKVDDIKRNYTVEEIGQLIGMDCSYYNYDQAVSLLLRVKPEALYNLIEVDYVSMQETARGSNGFGSTGK